MNTSSEAIKRLQQALALTQEARQMIDNLIVEHEYQDVATLVVQAAAALLESAAFMMESKDVEALDAIESADDLLDAVYDIIDAETDDEA